MSEEVYSLCFMCLVRCPIKVTAQHGQVSWIEGSPQVPGMGGSLCPRGVAGIALLDDTERLQTPLLPTGAQGAGDWRQAAWEEALDFVAGRLKTVIAEHGRHAVVFGERTNLSTLVSKTFMPAIQSPNHFTHNALCKGSVNMACRTNEIYLRCSTLILNALMGSIEARDGLFFKKGPGEVGGKPPRKLTEQPLPKPDKLRFDKVGTPELPLSDPDHGLPQMLPFAILHEDPYPIKAFISNRFDPLMSIPDSEFTKRALEKLELIVAIDLNFGDIAWYADVVLPESLYLERTDCVQQVNGLKPQLFLRSQAVALRYDTLPSAIILKQLAERLRVGRYLPYETMEGLVRWRLEGTGFTLVTVRAA